jgi:hypothetical protein
MVGFLFFQTPKTTTWQLMLAAEDLSVQLYYIQGISVPVHGTRHKAHQNRVPVNHRTGIIQPYVIL